MNNAYPLINLHNSPQFMLDVLATTFQANVMCFIELIMIYNKIKINL